MINIKRLKDICNMEYREFKNIVPYCGKNDYYFKDNGSNILAVAHLDTVITSKIFEHIRYTYSKKEYVISPRLDDRLGAYIILDLLPKLGIKYDILLTNNEENCNSTAKNFNCNKEYNWMFQFDRKGNDVVTYQYNNPEFVNALSKQFRIGIGTYSDICELTHLNICGVNIGTSYYNPHTVKCYCDLNELRLTIKKFVKFYNKNKGIKYANINKSISEYNRKDYFRHTNI